MNLAEQEEKKKSTRFQQTELHLQLISPPTFAAQLEGRPCEYNSKIYQNGESFQPNCKHQCTCIDGAVGCIPLCPQELSLPNLGCPNPRLVKVPGQCCEEWICDDAKGAPEEELDRFFGKEFGLEASEGELTRKNELIAIVKDGLEKLPGELRMPRVCSHRPGMGGDYCWNVQFMRSMY